MRSKVKRAGHLGTRPAPFVITMNWITTKDQEDDQADDDVAPHHELAERLHDVARVPVQQHEARDRHVDRQPGTEW